MDEIAKKTLMEEATVDSLREKRNTSEEGCGEVQG